MLIKDLKEDYPLVYEAAMDNFDISYMDLIEVDDNCPIEDAFDWENTSQDFDFWDAIYDSDFNEAKEICPHLFEDKNEFKTNDYVVCLPKSPKECPGAGFKSNYCVKIRRVDRYVLWYYHDGGCGIYKEECRKATQEEIEEYDRIGKPYDVTTLTDKPVKAKNKTSEWIKLETEQERLHAANYLKGKGFKCASYYNDYDSGNKYLHIYYKKGNPYSYQFLTSLADSNYKEISKSDLGLSLVSKPDESAKVDYKDYFVEGEWYIVDVGNTDKDYWLIKFRTIEDNQVCDYKSCPIDSTDISKYDFEGELCSLDDIKSARKATKGEIEQHFPNEFGTPLQDWQDCVLGHGCYEYPLHKDDSFKVKGKSKNKFDLASNSYSYLPELKKKSKQFKF